MMPAWKEYQEQAASFFRSLGLEAATDVTVGGVRTNHDIDVLVKSHHGGFDIVWLVECKNWQKPVSKLHVLGLREIVADIGADRGIILSESGFQSGAVEAANLTNVHVTSLQELRITASNDIYSMRFREIYDRTEQCRERYWQIPKAERKEHGLRPEAQEPGYSGARVVDLCNDVLSKAFRGIYPFKNDELAIVMEAALPTEFKCPREVVEHLEPLILELESKLENCEDSRKST